MIWLTWRQARFQTIAVFAGIALVIAALVVARPEPSYSDDEFAYIGTLLMLYLMPVVLGVFWGVPLVTRELETGTHHVAWNQTVTRTRWLATKLGLGAGTAMVATGLLSLVVTWWAGPLDAIGGGDEEAGFTARVAPLAFAARGLAPVGYAAFAFVLGLAVGLLLRRTLPAMAVTLVVFTAVQVLVPTLLRANALPPTEETVVITMDNFRGLSASDGVATQLMIESPAGVWVLANETVAADGTLVEELPVGMECLPHPPAGPGVARPDPSPIEQCLTSLADLGYRQHLVYQPASHFWPLQLMETAFFLALSGLLTWFCLRRIHQMS
jgi:hypothetical protein